MWDGTVKVTVVDIRNKLTGITRECGGAVGRITTYASPNEDGQRRERDAMIENIVQLAVHDFISKATRPELEYVIKKHWREFVDMMEKSGYRIIVELGVKEDE